MSVTTEVLSRLDAVSDRLEILTAGLDQMLDTMEIHAELLRRLTEAATQEPGESPLPALLQRIATALEDQTAAINRLSNGLAHA